MNGIRAPGAGAVGPVPVRNSVNTNRRDVSIVVMASPLRAGKDFARLPTPTLVARHAQWSQAVTQLLRIAQARSTARLQRDSMVSACEQGQSVALRTRRCVGTGLSACLVGCLALLALATLADSSDRDDHAPANPVTTAAGLAAYAVVAAALGLLCLGGGMHARVRLLQGRAERAAARVEALDLEFHDQKSQALSAEHELRLVHVRAALDEAFEPTALTALITEYVEAPRDAPTD